MLSKFNKDALDEKLRRDGPKAVLEQVLAHLETDARLNLRPKSELVDGVRYILRQTQNADGLLGLWNNVTEVLSRMMMAKYDLQDLPGFRLAIDIVRKHLEAAEVMQRHALVPDEMNMTAAKVSALRTVLIDLEHPAPDTRDLSEVCAPSSGRCTAPVSAKPQ